MKLTAGVVVRCGRRDIDGSYRRLAYRASRSGCGEGDPVDARGGVDMRRALRSASRPIAEVPSPSRNRARGRIRERDTQRSIAASWTGAEVNHRGCRRAAHRDDGSRCLGHRAAGARRGQDDRVATGRAVGMGGALECTCSTVTEVPSPGRHLSSSAVRECHIQRCTTHCRARIETDNRCCRCAHANACRGRLADRATRTACGQHHCVVARCAVDVRGTLHAAGGAIAEVPRPTGDRPRGRIRERHTQRRGTASWTSAEVHCRGRVLNQYADFVRVGTLGFRRIVGGH